MKAISKIIKAARKTFATAVLTGLAALGFLASAPKVEAQQSIPLVTYYLTNSAAFQMTGAIPVVTAFSTNINSQPFQIWRGRGLGLNLGVWTTNASGSNVNATLRFASRHKIPGTSTIVTNWITAGQGAPISFNFANNGTTEQFFFTNIPPTLLDNVDLGQLTTVTNNHLSSLFLDPTNCFISVFP